MDTGTEIKLFSTVQIVNRYYFPDSELIRKIISIFQKLVYELKKIDICHWQ